MYAEASSPNKKGDNTRIKSPTLSGNDKPRCLSFWYHMYGPSIGTLNLFVLVSKDNELDVVNYRTSHNALRILLSLKINLQIYFYIKPNGF